MSADRLGVAIIGTGAIARRFAEDMRYSSVATVRAIGARDRNKALSLAAAIGPKVIGTDLEAAITRSDVDLIYVATSNAVHAEHALLAISHRKPVLVEKPFATSADEATRVVEAARTAGVFAMEALWARFTPGNRRISSLLERGEIGAPRRLSAELAFARHKATSTSERGGALLDLGVYPVSLALQWLGPVVRTVASGRRDATGAIARAELLLDHGDAVSSLSAAWDVHGANRLSITGTTGTIEAASPLFAPPIITVRHSRASTGGANAEMAPTMIGRRPFLSHLASVKDGLRPLRGRRLLTVCVGSGLHYQVDHIAQCLREGWLESPIQPLDATLDALRVLDAAAGQID